MFGTFPQPWSPPMRRTMLSAILLLSAVACGGSSGDAITGNIPGAGSGPLSATIDGKAWASTVPAVIYRNNLVSVAGIDLALTASVSFGFGATGPGTFSLAPGNLVGGTGIIVKSNSQSWATALAGGSGSVTLTTLTTNHIVGTFAFDAVPSGGGATGTVHVTSGKFDITF